MMPPSKRLASDLKVLLEVAGVEKLPDVDYMAGVILAGFAAGAYAVERGPTPEGERELETKGPR